MQQISVVINTYNEEENIRNCLDSVAWADEIIIVDMHSEDNTVKIAQEYPNVTVSYFEKCGYADPGREFAFNQATKSWVLVLDADEMVSKKLYTRLLSIIAEDLYDVVYIPRQNYMFGEEIKCGDWGSEIISRFMKKTAVIGFNSAIHSQFYMFKPEARVLQLKQRDLAIIHFNYINIEHFLDKSNRYTTIDAENSFNKMKKPLSKGKLFIAAFLFIPKFMLQQKGYKNKFIGLALAVLMLNYHLTRYLKYMLMQKYNTLNTRQAIKEQYSKIATQVLSEYEV